MQKLSHQTKKEIERLVVAYHGYQSVNLNKEPNAVAVWGTMLMSAEDRTGIFMTDRENTKSVVEAAQRKREAA